MCLSIMDTALKIAENDIECWKVLKRNFVIGKPLSAKFFSEFKKFEYKIGEVYRLESPLVCTIDYNGCYFVDEGFHSFASKEDIERYIINLINPFHSIERELSMVLARCIIPRGSKYFEGIYASSKSYASDAIRIEEII